MDEAWGCSWLVERWPDLDPEDDWYPDSRADLLAECGAPCHEEAWGWWCEAGHRHVSDAQYYDDDEVAAIRRGHMAPAPVALAMDGYPF